jgi:hypothetical protein
LGAALIISFILALFSIPWLSMAGKARIEPDEADELADSEVSRA